MVTDATSNSLADSRGILDNPFGDLRHIMEIAFHIYRWCRRGPDFKETRINANTFASARCQGCQSIKDCSSGLIALAGLIVAENSGPANLAVVSIGVNGNMQISAKIVRRVAPICHSIILADHNFDAIAFQCDFTGFGNLATLNSLGSITVGIIILRLIRRRQINFLCHIYLLKLSMRAILLSSGSI